RMDEGHAEAACLQDLGNSNAMQVMLVNAIVTVSIRQVASPCTSASRSGVHGPNKRTGTIARSSGTYAHVSSLLLSRPAAYGCIYGCVAVRGGREGQYGWESSVVRGNPHLQTRSGRLKRPRATGSALSPSVATNHH